MPYKPDGEYVIHGSIAPGFEAVKKAFKENFSQKGELGAACAVYFRGEKVVDLWGGIRDEKTGEPWEENTLVLVFSTTKGLAAMCCAVAHSRGWLDYDEKVATYWPAFAQKGKEHITVAQLLNHQAGLSAIDVPLDLKILADQDQLSDFIAAQKPGWEPGTFHGYHGISFGWYIGALIRKADPKGRTLGQFFQEEIAQPLGIEFFIGLPEEIPDSRIARIKAWKRYQLFTNIDKIPRRFALHMLTPRSLTWRTFSNPPIMKKLDAYNDRPLRSIEAPGSNGIGQVRSIARAYSEFATGGKTLGLRTDTLKILSDPPVLPPGGTYDKVMHIPTAYTMGFGKPIPEFHFGSDQSAFGTPGAGGSFGFADPNTQIGFAYAMNRAGFYIYDDPREKALRNATYASLARMGVLTYKDP